MDAAGVRCEDILLKLAAIGVGRIKKSSIRYECKFVSFDVSRPTCIMVFNSETVTFGLVVFGAGQDS